MKQPPALWISLAVAALLALLAGVGLVVFMAISGMILRTEVRDDSLVVINKGGLIRQAHITVTIDKVAYELPARDLPRGETRIPWSDIAPGARASQFAGSSITAKRLGAPLTWYTAGSTGLAERPPGQPGPATRAPESQ
ncbi:MAG: hypothetical protein SFY69_04595 [Planctomycetota bacterium]|nr:hypothetical protein [Planctomycetota bacterium]